MDHSNKRMFVMWDVSYLVRDICKCIFVLGLIIIFVLVVISVYLLFDPLGTGWFSRTPLTKPSRTPLPKPSRTPLDTPRRTPLTKPSRTPLDTPRRTTLDTPSRSDYTLIKQPCSILHLAEKKTACFPNDTVTMSIGGNLGELIMDYASVWSIARMYGFKPFVHDGIIKRLNDVFEGLSIPSTNEFVQNGTSCNFGWRQLTIEDVIGKMQSINWMVDSLDTIVMNARNTSRIIVVGQWCVLGEMIVPSVPDLHEEFHYKPELLAGAQRDLSTFKDELQSVGNVSRTEEVVFVGIHVSREYYGGLLKGVSCCAEEVGVDYYRHAVHWMCNSLWKETAPNPVNIAFVVVSDDPIWCQKILIPALKDVDPDGNKRKPTFSDNMGNYDVFWRGRDDMTTSEDDLVLLSSCNHSIIACGTFGVWSALMAGGKTVVYDIARKGETKNSKWSSYPLLFATHMQNWAILS